MQLNNEQRKALLNKIIDNFPDYQYYVNEGGVITLKDQESKIQVFPQNENDYKIIFELEGETIEDNNPLWRNLHETLLVRRFNLDEKNKLKAQAEKSNDSQNKLNKFLGL